MTHEARMAVLVSRYATPFAVFLVSLGLVLGQPRSPVREICAGLLLFSVLFNLIVVYLLRTSARAPLILIRIRQVINLGVNIMLVYWLGGYWTPIWLLLALTPLATAIYDTRTKTLVVSFGASVILLILHALRPMNSSPVEWGQEIAWAGFIVIFSLLLNDLAALVREQSPG